MRFSLIEIAIMTTMISTVGSLTIKFIIWKLKEREEKKRIAEERKRNPWYKVYDELDD